MNEANFRKLTAFLFLGISLFTFTHCMQPKTNSDKNKLEFENTNMPVTTSDDGTDTGSSTGTTGDNGGNTTGDTGDNGSDPIDLRQVSLDAFATTVHPITRARCINCHGSFQQPLHAVADSVQAHDAVVNSFKVNFANTASSRLVLKLGEDKHNCWSVCETNAAEMLAAINDWKVRNDIAEAANNNGGDTGGGSTNVDGLKTSESDTVEMELNGNNATDVGTVVLLAEAATLKTPMERVVDGDINGVWVNSTGENLGDNDNTAGSSYFLYNLSMTDSYDVYAYINTPTGSDDSFHVKVGNNNYTEWHTGTTSGYEWRKVTSTSAMNDISYPIVAGNNQILEMRQREDGAKLSKVVITKDTGINLDDISGGVKVTLSYDLSGLLNNVPATFLIDLEEYDMYSYKFSNPRIMSGSNIHVKNIKPLINGQYNPQHATYTLIERTVTPGTTTLSPRALIALKSIGNAGDRISFAFEALEVR